MELRHSLCSSVLCSTYMSGLGDSVGEGGDGGIDGNRFNTGFQTHFGAGNVDAGMKSKKGAGYDEEGNVKTHLASPMSGFHYDPGSSRRCEESDSQLLLHHFTHFWLSLHDRARVFPLCLLGTGNGPNCSLRNYSGAQTYLDGSRCAIIDCTLQV